MISAVLIVLASRTWGEPKALCKITSPAVNESSGLASSPSQSGVFYTHNDSGDKARFLRFDKAGKVTGEFSLKGVKAVDWEDMASAKVGGRSYLYFADCGDNGRKRDTLTIYRVAEPTGDGRELAEFDTYTYIYPDKKRDCEAMMVDPKSGDLWLVSKATDQQTVVYRIAAPTKSGKQSAAKIAEIEVSTPGLGGNLVTGGDISPDGKYVVLRTYGGALEFDAPTKFSDWTKVKPRAVKTAAERQGEAIAYSRDGTAILTTSEGNPCPVSTIVLAK